jgi:tetratricopeptide (TPR) repeat protein
MQPARLSNRRQSRGLTWIGVVLLSAALLAAVGFSVLPWAPQVVPGFSGRRVVLLGLDGLDWAFLDSRIERGGLPHFARLRREGLSGPIESLRPVLSPILWTTMATGVGPDRHGVLDFFELDASGRPVPITSASRKTLAFWNLARGWGRTVGVVNWFGSWPAEPVPGWLVSDRLSYHSFFFGGSGPAAAGLTFPPELEARVSDLVVREEGLRDGDLAPYFGDLGAVRVLAAQDRLVERELKQFRHMLAAARTYQAVALRLLEERPVDLAAIYLDSYDTACHLYASYVPPRPEWIDEQRFRLFAPAVDRVVEDLDGFLGRLMERLGPQDRLFVVSDHGFRTGVDRLRTGSNLDAAMAADWHRPQGMSALFGPGVARGPIDGLSVLDVLPSLCALLGVAPNEGFEGRVPEAIARVAQPLPAVPGALERRPDETQPAEDPVAGEMQERLKALGYIGPGPAGASAGRFRVNYYNNLAVYLQKVKKDYPRAEQEFRRAQEADPNDLSVPGNLASLYIAEKKFDEALPLLEDVARKAPELLNARLNLAICLRVLGKLEEAARELRSLVETDAAYQPGWWNLGLTEEKAGHPAVAAEAYEKAAALLAEPAELAEAWNAAGLMWAGAGQMERAQQAFEKACAADAGAADPRINLANVHALSGRSEQARALFDEVLRRAPDDVKALNGLGQLDLQAGRVQEGRARLERSLKLRPDQPRIRQILASLR